MRSLTFDEQMELNRSAYAQVHDQIQQAGPGQFAAIAAGRLVAILGDFDSAVAAIQSLSPAPDHYLVFPTDAEPVFEVVDSFWGVCR